MTPRRGAQTQPKPSARVPRVTLRYKPRGANVNRCNFRVGRSSGIIWIQWLVKLGSARECEEEKGMSTAENKDVISAFIQDVLNEGRLERAEDLVLADFVELDPLPGQTQGREGLKEVIAQLRELSRISIGLSMRCWRKAQRYARASHGPAPIAACSLAFPPRITASP